MVGEYLGKAGFHVVHAESGARGLALHGREPLDVVILDLMLPDSDGLDICRQIRARSDTPILMLTARGDPMDRVVGLEMGADDYLPKPFEPRELLARLFWGEGQSRGRLEGDVFIWRYPSGSWQPSFGSCPGRACCGLFPPAGARWARSSKGRGK